MELFANVAAPACSAGVDEVGRGPLAGPVVAGAVVLDARRPIHGLADSKRLSAKRREALAGAIKSHALAWGLGEASVAEIDAMNILQASHLAMQRAVAALALTPELIFVDGNLLPNFAVPAVAVVKGDARVPQISAGAILAKVARDEMMRAMDTQLPGYGFAKNKGYPTAEHLAALRELGPSAQHRQSFAPVRQARRVKAPGAGGGLFEVGA